MKLSFVLSYQQTKFEAVGFGQFEKSLSLMEDLGYDAVEIAVRNPEIVDSSVLESKLDKYRLKLVAIGTGQAYVDKGISLMDLNHEIRQQAVSRIQKHMDLASNFDSQVIIGLIRGKISDSTMKEKQIGFLERSILELCSHAEKKQVILTIEPLNRYECNYLNTADEAISLMSKIGSPFLKLLLDTFHMNIEERDMVKTIVESQKYLSHMHIADSNRKFPGMGHIDFKMICRALKMIDFDGYLSGEILPQPNLETAMREYIGNLREVMNEHVLDASGN